MATKDCIFNIGIICSSGNSSECSKCGWSPKVEKERKAKLRGENVEVKDGEGE